MAIISRRAIASSSSSSTSSGTSLNKPTATSGTATDHPAAGARAVPSHAANKSVRRRTTLESAAKVLEPPVTALPIHAADPLRGSHVAASTASPAGQAATPALGSVAATPYTPQRNLTEQQQVAAERQRVREEFYATYDVMTGVRIAATLGGFFGLMVFLIVWKSRSSSNETLKVLKDPKMAAVAAVCMQEEEEREIQEAIVATGMSIYPDEYDDIVYRRQRMLSLGNVSAPPLVTRGQRFSSVGGGGYSNLLAPPRRFSYSAVSAGGGSLSAGGVRRRSGSESSRIFSNYPMGGSFGADDYFVETDDELEHDEYLQREQDLDELDNVAAVSVHKRSDSTRSKQGFLALPPAGQDSRRSSAMTCCSTDSSYLERRCSAFTLGLSNLPPTLQRKLSTTSRTSSIENWDYYYPDIQVIQPTPKASPCPSERSIYEQLKPTYEPPTTDKPARAQSQKAAKRTAASGIGGVVGLSAQPSFVRKHSIVSYDPDSAQAGRKQQIHSISADTVDVYPYNQHMVGVGSSAELMYELPKPIQSAPPTSIHQAFHFTDSPTEELRLGVRRKIAVVEVQRLPCGEQTLSHAAGAVAAASVCAPVVPAMATATSTTGPGTSSSISIDSTPVSMDKLNGSGSLGTISGKALFNVEKRAPLASLSSFKISSLEYQDSEMRSLGEDSVFVESTADTDEDMQQLSSDSDEVSLGSTPAVAAAMVHHDGIMFTRENTILRAPSATTAASAMQAMPADDCAKVSTSQQGVRVQPHHKPLKYPMEKRYSLGAVALYTGSAGSGNARCRRQLLQRHRTISASSSDRVSLICQPMQEFQASGSQGLNTAPLETHFGAVICTSSPPMHPRRAHLLQQYSDPQSLPTTTTTTTTTTTEDDTCSTLNTEVGLAEAAGAAVSGGGFGGESTTHTQYSSLNTVISIGRSSPLTDNNLVCSSASAASCVSALQASPLLVGSQKKLQQQHLQQQQQQQQLHLQQLPHTRHADDPCASSISDSALSKRPPIICMPATLKQQILRGANGQQQQQQQVPTTPPTRSASTFTSVPDTPVVQPSSAVPAVMLELPVIRLPTNESSDSSDASVAAALDQRTSRSDEKSHDPRLPPGSSRKWSKETLF